MFIGNYFTVRFIYNHSTNDTHIFTYTVIMFCYFIYHLIMYMKRCIALQNRLMDQPSFIHIPLPSNNGISDISSPKKFVSSSPITSEFERWWGDTYLQLLLNNILLSLIFQVKDIMFHLLPVILHWDPQMSISIV